MFKKQNGLQSIFGTITGILISLILGGLVILALGKDPIYIYNLLFVNSLGNTYGIGQVLYKATSLIFTGLSVAFAFKSGLFNIGAEGQLNIGAFCTAFCAFTFQSLPFYILIPLSVFFGFAGGALWGGIAGILKAKFGSHEVINTIMLNFIALSLVSYFINDIFNVPATIHSPEISGNAVIPRFDALIPMFKGSPFNLSFLVAIFCCFVMYYLIWKTPFGYGIKTTGLNINAAFYARINVKRITIITMLISGGFAGLVGTNFVLGYKHYFELGFSEGAGFVGIAVALLAKNNPFGIILVAIFFGVLEYGGLVINTIIPKELVTILQALVIITTIICSKVFDRKFAF